MFNFPLILDGATGTNMIERGLPKGALLEIFLLESYDNENIMKSLQSEFYEAGSDICYAPTFSANEIKLNHHGVKNQLDEYNSKLVKITRDTANKYTNKLVGGDIAPTGLFVEPFSDTKFVDIIEIYDKQAKALHVAGVDIFAVETMMSLYETRAAVLACLKYNLPIFVTITINELGKTLSGATPLSVLLTLQEMGVTAFGLNCSFGPDLMYGEVEKMIKYSKIPIIVKPNAGMPDPTIENKFDLNEQEMAEKIKPLLELGVSIIGGCCGTTPKHLAKIAKVVKEFNYKPFAPAKFTNIIYLTSENNIFPINIHDYKTTELSISDDVADDLMDLAEENIDIIKVVINSLEDAYNFSMNAHYSTLPIMFSSSDEKSLDYALLLYQGRAAIDKNTSIPLANLNALTECYGSFIL